MRIYSVLSRSKYIIKAPTFNNKSKIQTVDVTAIHIMYGFQDHYVYSNSKKKMIKIQNPIL